MLPGCAELRLHWPLLRRGVHVVLPGCGRELALELAERLRQSIFEEELDDPGHMISVSISLIWYAIPPELSGPRTHLSKQMISLSTKPKPGAQPRRSRVRCLLFLLYERGVMRDQNHIDDFCARTDSRQIFAPITLTFFPGESGDLATKLKISANQVNF